MTMKRLSIAITAALLCLFSTPAAWTQDDVPERTPAPVMSFHGAQWLERDTREEEERPDLVLELMDLKPGMMVADIGCGSGWYTRKIAKEIGPDGIAYGVDIQPEMLDYLVRFAKIAGIENIKPVLGDVDDPNLEPNSIDWMILADVYHEFQEPEPMLQKMMEALKPDGKICLLEYRDEDDTARHIKPEHRMTARQVLAEWNAAGFELIDYRDFLPSQHVFIFQRRPDRD